MSFSISISLTTKYKDFTVDQLSFIDSCEYYRENDWAQQNYKTMREFAKSRNKLYDGEDLTDEQIEEALKFYDDKENDLFRSIFYGGSGSMPFYRWINDTFAQEIEATSLLTLDKEKVGKCADFLYDLLLDKLERFDIRNGYVYVKDKESDPEEPDIRTKKIDGIEVTTETGGIERINAKYADNLYQSSLGEWEFSSLKGLLDVLIQILYKVDFSTTIVRFCGGW